MTVNGKGSRVAWNVLGNGLSFFCMTLLGLLTTVVVLRLFGVAALGWLAFVKLLTSGGGLTLLFFGVPFAVSRRMAENTEPAEVTRIFWSFLLACLAASFVVWCVLLTGLVLFEVNILEVVLLGEGGGRDAQFGLVLELMCWLFPVFAVNNMLAAALVGNQIFSVGWVFDFLQSLLFLCVVVVVFLIRQPFHVALYVWLALQVIRMFCHVFFLHRWLGVTWSGVMTAHVGLRRTLSELRISYMQSALGFASEGLVPIVVMRMLGAEGLGIFEIAQKLPWTCRTMLNYFNGALMPHFIRLRASGRGLARHMTVGLATHIGVSQFVFGMCALWLVPALMVITGTQVAGLVMPGLVFCVGLFFSAAVGFVSMLTGGDLAIIRRVNMVAGMELVVLCLALYWFSWGDVLVFVLVRSLVQVGSLFARGVVIHRALGQDWRGFVGRYVGLSVRLAMFFAAFLWLRVVLGELTFVEEVVLSSVASAVYLGFVYATTGVETRQEIWRIGRVLMQSAGVGR